jgi:hemerythrin superfamily protein
VSKRTAIPNIIDRLDEDHELIRALFQDIMFRNPEVREDVFCHLVTELVKHEVAEEMVVYPAIRADAPDGGGAVERRLKEQSEAEERLATMEKMDMRAMKFSVELHELNITLHRHARAEEQTIFPVLKAIETEDALIQLGDRYVKAKSSAPTHPHPHAPDTPPVNRILDPITALFDKARDAARSIAQLGET